MGPRGHLGALALALFGIAAMAMWSAASDDPPAASPVGQLVVVVALGLWAALAARFS